MAALELRVPVSRVDASLFTDDGVTHRVTLFLQPDQGLEQLFASDDPFVPVSEEGRVRIFSRASLAAVSVTGPPEEEEPAADEFVTVRRALIVRLRGGTTIEGTVCQIAVAGRSRTADLLNEPTPSFALHRAGVTYRIAKAHVACVDEV